jgi:hypothetical protein
MLSCVHLLFVSAAGEAADTLVSTTEMIDHPGSFPDTMFSEGLVTEANRTAGL